MIAYRLSEVPMAVQVKVYAIRYGYRTPENEDGPGSDGFVILKEIDGPRHAVIMFRDAVGTEMVEMMFRQPGEPFFCHELFADLLRDAGAVIERLTFVDGNENGTRPGTISLRQGERTWTRECSAFDIAGFCIASGVPITIEDKLFALMHEAAPDLALMMEDSEQGTATKTAERLALDPDDSHLGKA